MNKKAPKILPCARKKKSNDSINFDVNIASDRARMLTLGGPS